MKKNKKLILAACVGMSVLLVSCGNKEDKKESVIETEQETETAIVTEEETEAAESPAETETEKTTRAPVMAYDPSPEEMELYAKTWVYESGEAEDTVIYRLILSETEKISQLVVQNGIGELLGLYAGTWEITDQELVFLDMKKDPSFEDGPDLVQGNFSMIPEEDGNMTITPSPDVDGIVPGLGNETHSWYDEAQAFAEEEYLYEIRDAVLADYEAQTGETYPGYADVDDVTEDGVSIHLYEDMGDHTATAGWYLVDPDTLKGTDEILGTEIDFSPYFSK